MSDAANHVQHGDAYSALVCFVVSVDELGKPVRILPNLDKTGWRAMAGAVPLRSYYFNSFRFLFVEVSTDSDGTIQHSYIVHALIHMQIIISTMSLGRHRCWMCAACAVLIS